MKYLIKLYFEKNKRNEHSNVKETEEHYQIHMTRLGATFKWF